MQIDDDDAEVRRRAGGLAAAQVEKYFCVRLYAFDYSDYMLCRWEQLFGFNCCREESIKQTKANSKVHEKKSKEIA